MEIDVLNNKIIIIKDESKNSLLDEINSKKQLINYKIITLSELKKKYFFDYNEKAIFYICKKYNVNSDISKIYLENLYFINNKIDDEKVNFLYDLKQDLINNSLLITNNLFKKFLTNKDIILYNLKYVDKFYKNIFDELKLNNNVVEINNEKENDIKDLYEAKNVEEEISFVASKICELIKKGIDINNIKIANVNESNCFIIAKTFKIFNIPVDLPSFSTINGTKIVKKFKEFYSNDINETFKKLQLFVKSNNDNKVFKQLINIVNKYSFINYLDCKDLIYDEIEKTKIEDIKYNNSVKVIDIMNSIVSDNDYVFLINYNEGIIPHNYKDEDYLSDKLKQQLNISDSYDLNLNSMNELKSSIKNIKHLIVTYSKYNKKNDEIYISPSYEEDMFIKHEVNINFDNSNLYNKLKLVSLKDENYKYGEITDDLITLNNHYKNEKYLDYNNKFKGIDKSKLYEYLDKKLTLSYTSVNSYYECAFKYYLDYILKLNKYEDTFATVIGTIFHEILSKAFYENYDFENNWNEEIRTCKYEFNNMEKFFLVMLKDELKLIIDTIKNQLNYTSLKKSMYEKQINIEINQNLHIYFTGIIDKVLYDEIDGETIAVIIDYKTGNPKLDLKYIPYGLEMQLPIYIYLLKNSNVIDNVRIGGFYLQKIINSDRDISKRISNLKLQGYSNTDINILEKVDSSYENSQMIKGLKTTNNGFNKSAKLLNDDEIEDLFNLVDSKIKEASDDIINAKFDINPKQVNNVNFGCRYCKYKDICFMKYDDIKILNIENGDVNND